MYFNQHIPYLLVLYIFDLLSLVILINVKKMFFIHLPNSFYPNTFV